MIPKIWFSAPAAPKMRNIRVSVDMKNDPKITFFNCGIRSPSKKFLPVSRRFLSQRCEQNCSIPGDLWTSDLELSVSQFLQVSQSLSLSVSSPRERTAEVSMGRRVPYAQKKVFSRDSFGFCTPLYPPSTFSRVAPNAEINTQIGRCFRISFRRALDEVRFSTFLTPLMKRLISDCGPTNTILWLFPDMGGGGAPIMGNRWKPRNPGKCKGKCPLAGLGRLPKALKSLRSLRVGHQKPLQISGQADQKLQNP